MQTRVAVMAIIVEKGGAVERLNAVLHEYGEHIIGRMGIPYRKKGINIVSIARLMRRRIPFPRLRASLAILKDCA